MEQMEVYAYDVWEDHVRAINRRGLQISGVEDFTARLHATSDPHEIPPCDFGIVATKSTQTRGAIEQTAHVFGESSSVCSVQNGLGNEEILAQHVAFVIRGATFLAGHLVEPGHASLDSKGATWIGPFEPTNTPYARVKRLGDLLNHAGLHLTPMRDARGAQWAKLIFNASINPVGALTRLHHQAAAQFAATATLFDVLIKEGEAVAKALGIRLDVDPRELVKKGGDAPGKHNASMLQDILAKRQTEVDFLNGAIADCGELTGVPTPINRALCQLVKGLEHSWTNAE
jgi:2-dehydropantoate 2-reductase